MNTLLSRLEQIWLSAGADTLANSLKPLKEVIAGPGGKKILPFLELPGLCCASAGGYASDADDLSTAWGIFYLAAHWIDSVADHQAPEREISLRLSLASAALAAGDLILDDLSLDGPQGRNTHRAIRKEFHQAVLSASAGQAYDAAQLRPDLDESWRMVELKTGSVYALACRAGSRLVTDDEEALEQWGEFGLQLGVLVQIADDLQDIDPGSGANDLGSGQWNLAVAFAMDTATPSERLSLERDLQAARNDFSNLQALRSKILHSGAMLYLITEAERRRRRAEAALKAVSKPSPDRERLLELLNLAVSMRQP